MRDLMALTTLARLLGPGGTRAVIAETLLIKHQLVMALVHVSGLTAALATTQAGGR